MTILLSFLIAAFGQPAWVGLLSYPAALFGYGLFWSRIVDFKKRRRFWTSFFWFACVEAVHISWLTCIKYQGPPVLIVYLLLVALFAFQFASLSLFIERNISFWKAAFIASLWTLFEYSRLYIFTGFPWDPLGLHLAYGKTILLASLLGVYGLSFWTILVNGLFLRERKSLWLSFGLFPYFLGLFMTFFEPGTESHLKIALLETNIAPERKTLLPSLESSFELPLDQWRFILKKLKDGVDGPRDIIVLPEAAVSFPATATIASSAEAESLWRDIFQEERSFPQKVTNSDFAKALSSHFKCMVVIGMEEIDALECHNSAFVFKSDNTSQSYSKRFLVPMGEYIPFLWAASLAEKFGIKGSFAPGKEDKVFKNGNLSFSLSVCSDEAYSLPFRRSRQMGAQLFINVSNDGWFPSSRLPKQHLTQARLRASENGTALITACNDGVSAVIDGFGRVHASSNKEGVLNYTLSTSSLQTPYTVYGDSLILLLSLFFTIFYLKRTLKPI